MFIESRCVLFVDFYTGVDYWGLFGLLLDCGGQYADDFLFFYLFIIIMKLKTVFYVFCAFLLTVFILCEFLIYYIVLAKCNWPANPTGNVKPIRVMLLADTHLLGPIQGHWWDKLRREWQMHRAFQTSIQLFRPEVVFFLGDIFDEGHWVSHAEFREYVTRFNKLFHTPEGTRTIGVVGNHDVGFHYRLHPELIDRFDDAFNSSTVNLYTIRDMNFITINSMAMENDGCYFCEKAQIELEKIKKILKSQNPITQPVVLQHFPTFRRSDKNCLEGDAPKLEKYRENWEVLSANSTDLIGEFLNPRVIFSGHSHHYCKIKNRLKIEEFTLSSFSWRNKNNPSFLLALFTPDDYSVSLCYLPEETTVIMFYGLAVVLFCSVIALNMLYNMKIAGKKQVSKLK